MEPIKLKSGVELKITLAPFADSKNIYQAMAEELERVKVDSEDNVLNLRKNLFCVLLSSKKIESSIWKCMERATYGGVRITEDTFEPEEARGDYLEVCIKVAEENILPFMKSLSAEYSQLLGILKGSRA